MTFNGLVDEQLDIMCDSFFDNIDDLLDFPSEDEAFGMVNSSVDASKEQIDSLAFLTTNDEGCQVTANTEKNKLYDNNISEDWISKFLGDAKFEIELPPNNAIIGTSFNDYMDKDGSLFQSFSPISVLESSNIISNDNGGSSSSSSSSNSVSLAPVVPMLIPVPAYKARTNRPRRPSQALNAMILPKHDSIVEESCSKTVPKKMKRSIEDATLVRKCMHCGLEKTPQWRAGPMGPKTLCNACGVRYRSGRLYPEYRPAASPTFVPAIHSNSHKRVVEMRNKGGQNNGLKNCDLLEYIRRRD